MEINYRPPVYAKELKDVPPLYKVHDWMVSVDVNKLPKCQMRVRMCCPSCEDKVNEKIWEVPGVFHVRTNRQIDKVVVVTLPFRIGFDGKVTHQIWELESEVLRKARKIDCRAKFVPLDKDELIINKEIMDQPQPKKKFEPTKKPEPQPEPPYPSFGVCIHPPPTVRPPVIGPFYKELHRFDLGHLRERDPVWQEGSTLFYLLFFMLFAVMLTWK